MISPLVPTGEEPMRVDGIERGSAGEVADLVAKPVDAALQISWNRRLPCFPCLVSGSMSPTRRYRARSSPAFAVSIGIGSAQTADARFFDVAMAGDVIGSLSRTLEQESLRELWRKP
jgi:hypothetical protein